jgi:hypothetical protein
MDALDQLIADVWQPQTRVILAPDQPTWRERADRDEEVLINHAWPRAEVAAIVVSMPRPAAYEMVTHPERRDRWQVSVTRTTAVGAVECLASGSWNEGLALLIIQPAGWQPWPGYFDEL